MRMQNLTNLKGQQLSPAAQGPGSLLPCPLALGPLGREPSLQRHEERLGFWLGSPKGIQRPLKAPLTGKENLWLCQ